ncbi:MAG: hypothetical protein FWC91_03340 [Defluviitaleaceae bacterium]|nr:hypothetical protein [Defluviitaleaceae bacterium]
MNLFRDINRKVNKIERTSRSVNNTIRSINRTVNRNTPNNRASSNSKSTDTWICVCGNNNAGNFCAECGKGPVTCTKCSSAFQRPVKFCEHCGEKTTFEE